MNHFGSKSLGSRLSSRAQNFTKSKKNAALAEQVRAEVERAKADPSNSEAVYTELVAMINKMEKILSTCLGHEQNGRFVAMIPPTCLGQSRTAMVPCQPARVKSNTGDFWQ